MTVRRSVYRAIGGLDQEIFPLDDYDFQLRVAGEGFGVYYEHQPLASYRVHGSNESGASNSVRVGMKKLRMCRAGLAEVPPGQRAGATVHAAAR